ncbi:MAG: YARHG domain-containing protein [Allobaculum sp.]|nr:YARHG domain-containing protein [Allobaculum sp.]
MTNSNITPESLETDSALSSTKEVTSIESASSLKTQTEPANIVDTSNMNQESSIQDLETTKKEETTLPPVTKAHIQVRFQESQRQENQGFQFLSDQESQKATQFVNNPTMVTTFSHGDATSQNVFSENVALNSQEQREDSPLLPHNAYRATSSYEANSQPSSSYTGLKIFGLFGIVAAIGLVVYFALTFSNQVTQNQTQASIQAILSAAQRLADQNNPQGALTTVEEGLEKHPNNQNLLKQKSYYENEVEISKILSKAKSEEQNDPSQALATLATGLTLFPESTSLQQAQSTLRKTLKSDALEAATHYEEAQNFDRAIAVLDQAINMIGEDADLTSRKQLDTQKAQAKVKSQQTQQANNQIKVAQNQTISSTSTASTAPTTPEAPTKPAPSFVLPNSSTQLYSYEQVAQTVHSQTDLELAINEIYARNGRSFDTPKYKSYFEAQSWYTPTYSSSAFDAQRDTLLSPIELQNIETLVAYGQQQGWR